MITVRCANGHENVFDQPHPYHAGFSDVCFMYNDAGNLTLVWSSYDPTFEAFVKRLPDGLKTPTGALHAHIERALRPAPDGGRWRFDNPPRCLTCGEPIQAASSGDPIYFVVYPGSASLDPSGANARFQDVLRGAEATN